MKLSIALSALRVTGFIAATTERANAVVHCEYVSYRVGCVVMPGVGLRLRAVAPARVTPDGRGLGTPVNLCRPVPRRRGP